MSSMLYMVSYLFYDECEDNGADMGSEAKFES